MWAGEEGGDSVMAGDEGSTAFGDSFVPLGGAGVPGGAREMDDEVQDKAVALGDGGVVGGGASHFGDNGGNGGQGDGGGENDDGEGSRSSILSKYGKVESDLPDDVRGLSGAALDAYLAATRGGLPGALAAVWSGWRRRVAADPEFPFKLLMEQTVGLGLTVSGMVAARGKNILNELDFALCDTIVGATMNFVLVYLLTPVLVPGASAVGGGMGLPANLFAKGQYSLLSRVMGFMHKSALFSVCGFTAAVAGTSVSKALVSLRPKDENRPELPNLLVNSAAWAGFMFISSSPRYQAVAGLERALFDFAPDTVAKVGSGVVRTANNVLGGATWVVWAKAIGLQKSEPTSIDEVPLKSGENVQVAPAVRGEQQEKRQESLPHAAVTTKPESDTPN